MHYKLLLSLAFNFLSKMPGLLVVAFVLPQVKRGLGLGAYGHLLSTLALAAVFTAPLNGVNVVARRLITRAHANDMVHEEADGFISGGLAALFVSITGAGLCAIIASRSPGTSSATYTTLAVLLVALSGLNFFDSARAAYNEHFVTAAAQMIIQLGFIAALLWSPAISQGALTTGLLMQGSFFLASLFSGLLLILQKPALLLGRPRGLPQIFRSGIPIAIADGSLFLLLNTSVVWFANHAGPAGAAWYGTINRLFVTLLTPVMLALFPLSSFVSLRWFQQTSDGRSRLLMWILLGGLGYAALSYLAIVVGAHAYISHVVKIPAYGTALDLGCISLLFAAVVAQKSYTTFLYAFETTNALSGATAIVVAIGAAAGAVSIHFLTPLQSLEVVCASVGVPLVGVLVSDCMRRRRYLYEEVAQGR